MAKTTTSTANQGATATVLTLPDGIEIFRAGRHIDDQGVAHNFSDADVAGIAAGYNPALREAPLCVGHPKDNLPAYGWVKAVARNGDGVLTITPHEVAPQFAEMVQAKLFKKRSASFYPPSAPNNPTPGKWYLRHVAFLGAQPPAIAGLKDIQFSEADATGSVNFSTPTEIITDPQEPDDMSKELQEQLAAAQAALKVSQEAEATAKADAATAKAAANASAAQAASFAEKAKADRKASFVSFAEVQVKSATLKPADKDMVVATLELLADAAPVEFSEGDATRKVSPVQWMQSFIATRQPVVSFGEFAGTSLGGTDATGQAKGKSDSDIDKAAKAYMHQHKVNYSDALSAVTSFTS